MTHRRARVFRPFWAASLICAWLLAPLPLRAGDELPRWRLELGASHALHRDLYEHYMFNPAARAISLPASGWERKWSEERAWAGLSYDVVSGEHWRLTPGLRLGQSWGRFAASNNGLNFSEQWRTRPALLWGGSLEVELRQGRADGLFLRMRYGHQRAAAGEDREETSPNRAGQGGDQRDAGFRWREDEALLALGWRAGRWRPWLGVSWLDWRLEKKLHYHIPEESSRGPADLAVIRALNARDSEYHYHNENVWSPAAGLEWEPWPDFYLGLQARHPGHQEVALTLSWSF